VIWVAQDDQERGMVEGSWCRSKVMIAWVGEIQDRQRSRKGGMFGFS
jgi:hypothetical protein